MSQVLTKSENESLHERGKPKLSQFVFKSGEIPDPIWLQLMISFLECNLICFATDDLVASIHLPDAVIIAVLHP